MSTHRLAARSLVSLLATVCIASLVAPPAHSQHAEYRFETVAGAGVLSWSVFQDSRGFLWIATWEGLYRYDGYTFQGYFHDPQDSTTISSNNVSQVFEDSRGMFWVQTYGTGRYVALHRFDARTRIFTRLTHSLDALGGENARVHAFFEDRAGVLWLGSDAGAFTYDHVLQTFSRYAPDSGALDGVAIRAFHEDEDGSLWIGFVAGDSMAGGLARVNRDRELSSVFTHEPTNPSSIGPGGVGALLEDSAGRLWVGTGKGGLCRMDRSSGDFSCYGHDPADSTTVSDPTVTTIEEDREQMLWVGTPAGLNRFDPRSGLFQRIAYDATNDANTAPGGDIEQIFRDRTGVLWISTWGGGLSKLSRPDPLFTVYAPPSRHPMIGGPFRDRSGNVWVGSADGLHHLDVGTKKWTSFRPDPNNSAPISHFIAGDILEDSSGVFWISTFGGGLNRYDPRTGVFSAFRHDPDDATSLSSDRIRSLYEDRSGRLWVGAWGGLNLFDRKTLRFTRYVHDPKDSKTIGSGIVGPILEDHAGHIWAGTEIGGLSKLNEEDGTFARYFADPSDPHSLNSDWIMALHQDRDGIFWVGTNDGGVNRFEEKSGIFTHFTEANSCLPDNRIMAIFEDDAGHLWLNTGAGVVRFDRTAHTCVTFDERDGLFDERGYFNSHMAADGEILFPALGGVQSFYPERLEANMQAPPVVLTDLMIGRQSVHPAPRGVLREDIAWTDEISLQHDQNDVSFEYAALHFVRPDRNRYMYKLEGYDGEWVDAGTQRTATYTNLDPGRYTFRAKAANSDGVWNEEGSSIQVIVRPPWWQTSWAYVLYVLLASGGVVVVDRVQRRRLVRQERARAQVREAELRAEALEAENRRKELELEKARELKVLNDQLRAHEAQLQVRNRRLREMDEVKSRFFANISHEFRTPLTLLLGPLEDALKGERALDDRQLGLMRRSALRLLGLVGQLLDLSKLEAGSMRLDLLQGDIVEFVRRVVLTFSSRAECEGVTLSFSANRAEIMWCFDPDKLEQIASNLLSNAFKFTPAHGKIRVSVEQVEHDDGPRVDITVRDTGEGIGAKDLPLIFDRFYQVDASSTRRHGGTGIGLALSKELVEAHGGSIRVESEVGFGSTFVVRLPLITDEGVEEVHTVVHADERVHDAAAPVVEDDGTEEGDRVSADAPTVLVVEDDPDVRMYLRERLQDRYRVEEAADGAAGLKQVRGVRPDLIVSDVMMPERDGFDLCRLVKADPELNHIPIILLTARADENSTIEGLEAGADDYLIKPFSADELLARVENLIELRRALRARFSEEVVLKPTDVTVLSADAAFVDQVRKLVEEHMGESEFGVEWLAGEIGVSTRHLHRKLRQLTDLSPVGFIRMMRLERAAQLLRRDAGTVSEIAYTVGFSSTSYFSRLFKQAFGTTPSEFAGDEGSQIGHE